jgi:putative membrane protein
MNSSHRHIIGAGIIILFHVCGLIGIDRTQYAPLFEQASWFTILLSFMLIIWCDEQESKGPLSIFMILTFLAGMAVEVIGVHTGAIFGGYHYTPLLGMAVMGVPLMIGINWILMTYTTGTVVSLIDMPVWARITGGAILMMLCDVLLEGFAIRHHLWVWDTGTPPHENFIGWFVVSLILQGFFQFLIPTSKNKLTVIYLIVLALFLIGDQALSK